MTLTTPRPAHIIEDTGNDVTITYHGRTLTLYLQLVCREYMVPGHYLGCVVDDEGLALTEQQTFTMHRNGDYENMLTTLFQDAIERIHIDEEPDI